MSMACEEVVVFPCGTDELVGIVHHPLIADGQLAPQETIGVLIIVGGPQYRVGSHRQFILMARALAVAGYAVMRFDYRGMGDSDGEPRTFEHISLDLQAAMDQFERSAAYLSGIVLWGLCDAASAALINGAGDARVHGLILANPWVRTETGEARAYLRHYYVARLLQKAFWSQVFSARVNPLRALAELARIASRARSTSREGGTVTPFLVRMQAAMSAFQQPILLLISERDLTAKEFMGLCATSPAWRALTTRSNVRIEQLAGADHTFSQREALDRAVEHSRRWLAALSSVAGTVHGSSSARP